MEILDLHVRETNLSLMDQQKVQVEVLTASMGAKFHTPWFDIHA